MPPSDHSFAATFPLHAAVHASFMSNSTISACGNHFRRQSASPGSVSSPPRSSSFGGYFPFTRPTSTLILPDTMRERRVRFVSHSTVHYILPRSEFTTEEVRNTWYDRKEVKAMKQQCKADAAEISVSDYEMEQMRIRDYSPLSVLTNRQMDSSSTVRGLENKTSMGAIRKKRHRMQAWMAVFAEQARQETEGVTNARALADVYFEVSEPCHVAANMVAIRDARDVQEGNSIQFAFPHQQLCNSPEGKENIAIRSESPLSVDQFDRCYQLLSRSKHLLDYDDQADEESVAVKSQLLQT